MTEVVIDASALLALLNSEPGAEIVNGALPGAAMSAVNLSEVVAKMCRAGMPEKTIRQALQPLGLEIISFNEGQAYEVGLLYGPTRTAGLSLADRACLNTAKQLGVPAITADRSWAGLDIGAEIKVIR